MNCDRIARWYRWLEYAGFGRALERRREEFLPDLQAARRALVLGDGDGRFLAALMRRNRTVHADAVDSSMRMLDLARDRIAEIGPHALERTRFHHADACEWPLPAHEGYDLIVTHFFLDCLDDAQVDALAARIAAAAAEQAIWVVSEFHVPEGPLAAWCARIWIGGLYAFFRVATGLRAGRLPAYRASLEKLGFSRQRHVTARMGLLVSEFWQKS